MQRRAFLKNGALSVFFAGLGGTLPDVLRATALSPSAGGTAGGRTLVCIFQRGAMDGISAVQPLDDPELARVRPQLLLSATEATKAGDKLLPLNDRFGLHPELAPLLPLYRDGRLAIVHGVGSPIVNRSHFDMQDYMENGTPGIKSTDSGWLNRLSGELGGTPSPFRAVSLTTVKPRSFFGTAPGLAVDRLEALQLEGGEDWAGTLVQRYAREGGALGTAGQEGLEALRLLRSKQVTDIPTGDGYPDSPLGRSLRQTAQLIKAGVGLEIAFAESNGWDSHSYQLGPYGGFTRLADDLAQSIAAFWRDLGKQQNEVILMTMTEFGRTIAENGSRGTDHGRGSCQFILGNNVNGGRIYGEVPRSLVPDALAEGRDLPVTTDFRSVCGSVVAGHLGVIGLQNVFPGYGGTYLRELVKG